MVTTPPKPSGVADGACTPEGVDAPTIERVSSVLLEVRGVAGGVADRLPDAERLVGLHALSAELLNEEA